MTDPKPLLQSVRPTYSRSFCPRIACRKCAFDQLSVSLYCDTRPKTKRQRQIRGRPALALPRPLRGGVAAAPSRRAVGKVK
jgi:hypothetical protein